MIRCLLVLAAVLALAACGGGSQAHETTPATPDHAHEGGHADEGGHAHEEGHEHGGHHGGPLGHRFEKAEDWAKVFDDPARDAWQKPAEVVTLSAVSPKMTVADLGAGTGYFIPYLARAVGPQGKVLALDVEPDMVRYLKERFAREKIANAEAAQVPYDDPQLPAGKVDRVLIVDTWHHIPDRPAYVKKLARGLTPGGRVVVVDFTLEAEHGPPKHARIPPEKVVEELGQGGLAAEIVKETLPEQYVVVGRLEK